MSAYTKPTTKAKTCKHHGEVEHRLTGKGRNQGYRCSSCIEDNSRQTVEKNRSDKRYFVKMLGGKCMVCGYNKYDGGLTFHHIDPSKKKFSISERSKGLSRTFDDFIQEIKKCALLCHNCHSEVHAGLVDLESILLEESLAAAPYVLPSNLLELDEFLDTLLEY